MRESAPQPGLQLFAEDNPQRLDRLKFVLALGGLAPEAAFFFRLGDRVEVPFDGARIVQVPKDDGLS